MSVDYNATRMMLHDHQVECRANLAKLRELAMHASKRVNSAQASDRAGRVYWQGVETGLRRAISVLEGRG